MINRILIAVLCMFFCSCGDMLRDRIVDKSELVGADYRLFQDTPAWELAKAVADEDGNKIREILAQEPKLVNYQDPKYGNTLLQLTIMNQQMRSFKILLESGADLSIHNTYDGTSALIQACSFKAYDTAYAEMLLKNGANVNDVETGERREGNTTRSTPLIMASEEGNLDLVEMLVRNGANIDYQNEYKHSALSRAAILRRYDVVLYLLKNRGSYNLPISYNQEQNKTYYLADELRFYMPDLGSKEYRQKQEIISFLRSKGIEYKKVPIPEYVKEKAKEDYPNSWEEYLEKY